MPRDLIGEVLLDQFRVETYLASGGMATIYRVWDQQRSVPLAMKVLHPELADDPAFIARFEGEARSLEELVHPHIVPFYGLYRGGGLTFLLERYIDGPSLDEVLRSRAGRPLALPKALVFFKALYTSLGYAHAKGIIHCDVKPGNVLIDQGGHITLTDFGIARYMDASLTTSSALGTPLYMAPEQIRGERVSPQTDIYSLGVVLFELLTGARPFRGDVHTPPELGSAPADRIRFQHLNQPPPDPRAINPEIPPALAAVVTRAMAKDPRERFSSAPEMARAVERAIAARLDSLPDRTRVHEEMRAAPSWPWAAPAGESAWEQQSEPAPGPSDTLPGVPPAPSRPRPEYALSGEYAPAPEYTPAEAPPRRRSRLPLMLAALGLLAFCLAAGAALARGLGADIGALPQTGGERATADAGAALPGAGTATPEVVTATPGAEPTGGGFTLPWPFGRRTPQPATPQIPPPRDGEGQEGPVTGELSDFPVRGEMAVVRRWEGRDRIVILNLETGAEDPLPEVPNVQVSVSQAPQWSPDGQRLTWMSQYGGRMHVVVMDMDEREPYQLPAGESFERISSPTFLPGGEQVAFWAFGGGANWLVTADALTGEEVERVQLPFYRNLFAFGGQDGRAAFVQQMNGLYEVVVSGDPAGAGTRIDVPGDEYAPAWSADGARVAFQADAERDPGMNEIWTAQADGGGPARITRSPDGTWSRAPTWSPDGGQIAFVSDRSGSLGADYGELFVVDVEIGAVRQITNTGGQIYDWRPAWRPAR